MLVFTRKRGEAITIGDGIRIEVLRTGRDGVRIGVVAPPDVAVHRHEIYEQIREANQRAAAGPQDLGEVARRLRDRR
jgi:carbon storage regulator